MRIKNFIILFGLLVSGLLVNAQSSTIKFEEYDLDNGLHVILQQDKSTPIVAVTTMYHVGSKNEIPNRTGFAHLFEHLMFEGTENIGRGEFSEIVEKAGGTLNANTSSDRTFYYELLPSNQIELGIWLESERMMHAKIDSIGIQTQKKVVIEEKKQSYDNRPYGSVLIEIMKRAFEEHPYRWTTIGDPDHIRAASDDYIKSFYKDFYVPNNAVVTISGDFDIKSTKKLVKKYYSDIPKGEKEIYRPNIVEPKNNEEIRDTIFDNVQLPAVIQSYNIPAMGTSDYYAVQMLSTLLSGGQSSRLYKTLVDEKQLALQAMSFPFPLEDPGIALIFALPNMGVDPMDMEKAMNLEVEKVRNELISDNEMQKLRNQFENDIVSKNTTIAERANNLATKYTYFNDASLVNSELEKYLAVTKEDIKNVASKYFIPENRVVLYYLPKQDSKK
ncbi:MAG: pitrilysin family protein [Bacteroidales bacterium]|jgi:zinc protease|nr:pitrilysin family protein [Bacteroidales bacterium]